MNPLEKELIKNSVKTVIENEEIVNDVKLLLEADVQEERRLLGLIGLDNDIRFAENKNADIITRKTHTDKLGTPIVHINEIKELCEKYYLHLKPAREYIGTIPLETGAELNRFCKEKNIPIPNNSAYSKFYIIAPPKMFKGHQSFTEIIKQEWNLSVKEAEQKRLARSLDPILVYMTDDSNYFAIIKSWGNDFTPLRRLKGIITRPSFVKFAVFAMDVIAVVAMLYLTVIGVNYFSDLADKNQNPGYFILIIGIILGSVLATIGYFASDAIISFRRRMKNKLPNTDYINLR